MVNRTLPAFLVPAALVLAPVGAAAQTMMMGPGVRTEMTPSTREAHNGVFDHIKRGFALGLKKAEISVGEVETIHRLTPEDVASAYVSEAHPYTTDPPPKARPKSAGAPVNSGADKKPLPPGADPRQVRPAEAFPPERIETTPPAPSRAGVDTPPATPRDDPRSVEERKDPGG